MTDLATVGCDWQLDGGAPALMRQDDTLLTSVILSIFTDARADDEDELPVGEEDPRGWWGEIFAEEGAAPLGSRLWLLQREKQTTQTLARARQYVREALQWLIDDSVAQRVDINTSWVALGQMEISISIERFRGAGAQFSLSWDRVAEEVQVRAD